MEGDGMKVIRGSAYALGIRGNRVTLEEHDAMLAREWRRYTLFGPEHYYGYFRDHPEHAELYRGYLTNPPPEAVGGPIAEQLRAARAALDAAILQVDQMGV